MAVEEMLAEILAKLEDMNALWLSPAEQLMPSSPPTTNILTADTEKPEARASSTSTTAATASTASLVPLATSTSPQDADLGFQPDSGITELSYIHRTFPNPIVSIDGDFCVPFDADDRGTDRLSRLPDSLLRDIVSRLPLKDAARTLVLSHHWSPIWRAALLLIGHTDFTVFHLNSGLVPRSMDKRLEQIRRQQQGGADFHHYLFSNDTNPPSIRHLGFSSVDFHLADDPTCKVAGYLFVVQRRVQVIYNDVAFNVVLRNNTTSSNLVTVASASPTPSLISTPSQDATLAFQFDTTELLDASPTRCSTLSLYHSSSTFAVVQDSKLQSDIGNTKHLLLPHAKRSILDTPKQDIINNHTAMVGRYCCMFGVHI